MPQENGLLEMEGSVENIVYHNDSNQYTVLEVDCGEELITVVGTFPYVSVGERLHLYGTWTSHATFGQQFRAQAFERSRPADTAAMLKYLSSGAVKGIGGALAGRIIEAFGDESIKVIEEDPARLATVKGITLKKAKEISEEMQRVNGIRDLMAFLGSFGVRPEDTVKVWKVYGQDSVACIQEDPYRLCSDKIGISFAVADQLAESLEYDRDNKERVKAGVLYVLRHNLNNGHTCLPADKLCAAKRMSELTGVEAKTIHRMLQVDWDDNDAPVFQRNERNPLECDAVVIDELSMVDAYVFESVLRALPIGCRLILVGDSDQLPSVGPGNVIGDLIASKVFPTVQLKEIFRQSMESLIVMNAHKIVEGEMPELSVRSNDFFFMPREDARSVSETVQSLVVTRLPKSYGYSPVTDIQVLCPGRKGELGTVELNRKLREQINPPAKNKPQVTVNGTVFREGDKVMQIKNDYNLPWSREDGTVGEGVYNGDMGIIIDVDKDAGCLRVEIDDKEVLYDFEHAAAELELAYAVTVHKSQGNEFMAVVMPMFPGAPQLSYRNLLYTGITRAKKLLILVGKRSVVADMVANDKKTRRFSGLQHFLLEKPEEDGITHWNAVRRSGTGSRFGHPCGGSSSKTERTLRNRLQS